MKKRNLFFIVLLLFGSILWGCGQKNDKSETRIGNSQPENVILDSSQVM